MQLFFPQLNAKWLWSKLFFACIMVFESGGVFANSENNRSSRIAQLELKINNYMGQIKETIGDARCDSSSQCRALAVGSRACGGPSVYLPYSIVNTNINRLKGLAQQHGLLERQVNRIRNVISTCEMVLQPPIACVKQQCTITR